MSSTNDIISQRNFLENKVIQVLDIAKKHSDETAVLITKTTGITVSTRNGTLESVEFDNRKTLEITVFHKQRKGTAISNDFNDPVIINTVNAAVSISNYTYSDVCSGIADKDLLAFYPLELNLFHPISLTTKLGMTLAITAEKTALKYDKRIISTEGSRFNGYFITKAFGNSHGMVKSYSMSQYSLFCSVIAENNGHMEQGYAYTISRVFNDLCSSEWVGTESAQKALKHLNSRKINTTESPVLFTAEIATSLFSHLAHAIHCSNVYRQSTFLLSYLKKRIFPNWISINEYPHILKGLSSAPFDNEGVKTIDRAIVTNGILNTWISNSYFARKIGLKSTGHANGIYNWHVSYQDQNFEELIKNMYRGLIVTDIMGQGINIMTGDYSRGISGFWVENGIIQYPVSEVTIAGNLKEMFYNIDSISNDIEKRSNIHCGSVLISSMKIAGI